MLNIKKGINYYLQIIQINIENENLHSEYGKSSL